jgi:hypothetical protein
MVNLDALTKAQSICNSKNVEEKKNFPQLTKSLFWDCDTSKLDFDIDKKLVLERVFSRGFESDEREVCRYYGINTIKKIVTQITYLDKKTLNYLSVLLGIPERRFKCYKKTLSANPFGMF